MKSITTLVLASVASLTSASLSLFRRQTSSGPSTAYLDSVCSPNVTSSRSGTLLPPCISIVNIQTQCQPNGTTPLDYMAHAECLCDAPSSFFTDWIGCRQCLYVHGGLTQQQLNQYSAVISAVSTSLCTGTPTAPFQSYFASAGSLGAAVTSGATVSSDQFPSQTAVSLYFTASGSQGPGAITGSATAATASGTKTSASSGSRATSGSGATGVSQGSSPSSTSSSSSKSNAKATNAAFLPGMAMAVVGGLAVVV